MQGPLVSAVIGHYNRDMSLARLLRCLHRQTYESLEILITADGSPPYEPFLWHGKPTLLAHLIEWEAWDKVRWIDFERQENGFPQMAKCANVGARLAKGEMILVLNNDWWLEDAWVENMVASLLALGKKNHMVGVQKGRRHAIVGLWPWEACIAPLPCFAYVDSGATNLVWREDWIDFDESLDLTGSIHQFPIWGLAQLWNGCRLWYNSTLIMKHVHPKSRLRTYTRLVGAEKAKAMYPQDRDQYHEICRSISQGTYKITRLRDEPSKGLDETISERDHRPLQP